MKNINFVDRIDEQRKLASIAKTDFFLVVKGRRRIGKTSLLKRAFPDSVYLFIWPDKSLDWIISRICAEYSLPQFKAMKDVLEHLLDAKKIVILDEFQNFLSVDKSVYGEIQHLIDNRRFSKKATRLAVAGSSYSLINKVLNDAASPLYGRRTEEITLTHLPIQDLYLELNIKMSEFISLWSVFEGVPYYYEMIDYGLPAQKNIKNLVLSKNSKLQDEGKALLSIEFGKDSKTYGTVLTGISEGMSRLNELAALFDNKKNEVVKYLDILRKEFRLVRKMTPVMEDPDKSREGKYEIIDNFLLFWFYSVDKFRNYIEQERFEEMELFFDKNFNTYVGKKFEKFIITLIKDKALLSQHGFTKIGPQWGKFKGEKGKNTYEIDIVAINDDTNDILFAECKWQDKVDAETILSELKEKSKYVDWNNEKRKEHFALFAKSFKNKKIKDVKLFDLKDIEKIFKKRK